MSRPEERAGRWSARPAVLVTLLLAGAIRLIYLFLYAHDFPLYRAPLVDAKIYDEWARAIAHGDLLGRAEGVFYRAPLYPYLMALVIRVLGNPLPWMAILQVGCGLCSIYFVSRLADRIGGARAGLAAALLLALYGPMIAAESKLLATSLGLTLHLATLLMALRHAEHPRMRRGLAAGLLLGFACLVRPQWLGLTLLLPLVLSAEWGRGWLLPCVRRWAPFWLGAALIVAPVALRNRLVGHDWVLISSNGGMTFFQGNNEENQSGLLTIVKKFDLFGSATEQRALETRVAEREMGRSLKASETSRFWTRQALDFITGHPGAWLKLEGKKLYRFVTGYEYADNYSYYIERGRLWPLLLTFAPFGLFLALGAAGFCLGSGRDAQAWRVTLLSATYGLLGCLAFYVSSRYRMEVVPALAVAGGVALTAFVDAARRLRPWPRLALVLALALFAASYLPAGAAARSQESITWLQVGNAYEGSKRPDDALTAYRKSIELLPENVFAWNNLILLTSRQETPEAAYAMLAEVPPSGQTHPMTLYLKGHLLARLGREDEAVDAYEQALRANPLLKEAQFNLALIYEKRRAYEQAASHLEEARRLGDETNELYSHLGYIYLQERRYPDARPMFEELLRRNADDDEARFNLTATVFYLGDLEATARHLEYLARRSGDDPLLLYYRGLLALRRGQPEAAERDLTRALAAAPTNARARYYLAQARGGRSLDFADWASAYGALPTSAQSELASWFAARAAAGWAAPIEGQAASAFDRLAALPAARELVFDLRRFAEEEAGARP